MFLRTLRRPLAAILLPAVLAAPAFAQDQDQAGAKAKKAEKPKVTVFAPKGRYLDLAEAGADPTALLLGGVQKPRPFFPVIEALRAFAADKEAKVLLVDLSGDPAFNLPQLHELERAFAEVRQAGKRIVAFGEGLNAVAMQIAANADKVLLPEMGAVDLRSPAMSVMHMKDALDLLGVQAEVTRVGEYKGAVEPYVLSRMSDHLKAHYQAMLATMNDDVVRRLAAGRKLEPAKVRELQGQRLFSATAAKAAGLVDELVPFHGAERAFEQELGLGDIELKDVMPKKKAKNRDLLALLAEMARGKKEVEIEDAPQVVVLHLSGQIVDGDKAVAGSMVSGASVQLIDKLADSKDVQGVVVRVNSPGGSATASEAIRLALQRLAAKKPVVYSMGDLAASGGYWITTIGRPIVAEPTTITGSIGVFGMRFQTGALMRRLGVQTEIVALDDGPAMDATDRPWSDAARARMQGFVDEIYVRFLHHVGASRGMDPKDVDKIAGGRVWSGAQALQLKLVDRLGGLDDALAMVKAEAKCKPDVEVVHLPEPRNFADSFFESLFEAQALCFDRATLALVLGQLGDGGALLAVLRQALAGDGRMQVYALDPAVVRLR